MRSFTLESVGEGIGVMGQLVRISVEYAGGREGPATVIAKFPSPTAANREVAGQYRFYEREVRFYEEFAGRLPIQTPACYFSHFDPPSGDFALLLEDLGELRLGDQVQGCSPEEATMLASLLGQLHAATWGEPKLSELDWLTPLDHPLYVEHIPASVAQSWDGYLQRFGEHVPRSIREAKNAFVAAEPSILRRLARPPRCLAHGDFRLDNLFFGKSDTVVIDWQIALAGRGPYDLGYFMSQSLDPADRRECERDVVETYHSTLAAEGVSDYRLEQCWEDYRLAVLHCLIYPVITAGTLDLANERGVAFARAMTIRSAAAIIDLDALSLIES